MSYSGKSNFFFNNYRNSREQQLLESLVTESISIMGEGMYYLPRKINSLDPLYTADVASSYEQAFLVPIYIENVMGFKGDGSYVGHFGIEVRDRVVFSISQTVFANEIATSTNQLRPGEGDLIYFPLNDKCFQIKYVEKFEMFYALGALYTWKMECELFEYSGEKMSTGIASIDNLQTQFDLNMVDWAIRTEEGHPIMTEEFRYLCIDGSGVWQKDPVDQSKTLQEKSSDIIDFSVLDPFSEGHIGTDGSVIANGE